MNLKTGAKALFVGAALAADSGDAARPAADARSLTLSPMPVSQAPVLPVSEGTTQRDVLTSLGVGMLGVGAVTGLALAGDACVRRRYGRQIDWKNGLPI
ncbi:MAG TPA: hypothetical protein VHA82_09490 [Ramlibacter sp.]|uniref:hypothetical protein n=1 Tax=Ramlibacter sp. TaxID=1917967 RepID=UPI002BB83F58|nr:hypothetical protein [Ramlibacter sp.]HVZ44032.1 hypothetical protein [Ramlibacter sp.]